MKLIATPFVVLMIATGFAPAMASVLRTAVLGCKAPADASKLPALEARRDNASIQTLTASRSCISFAKGITIEVDEAKGQLSCIRLTGDLDCYWVSTTVVDDFPSEKGSGGPKQGGRNRH